MNITRALAIDGYMSEIELTYIAYLAARSSLIVEVGTYKGRSARAWADNTFGVLFAVDYWRDGGEANWDQNLADCTNVMKVKMYSCRAAAALAKIDIEFDLFKAGLTFDCIFLDGGHNYDEIHADILAWRPLLRESGIFCGHDFQSEFPGVIRAVTELVPKFRIVDGGSIWTTEGVA